MEPVSLLVICTVGIVIVFDYTNGFHDAANIVAPMIASRALTPIQAVIVVATFEFLGPLLGGTAVANTIGKVVDLGTLPSNISMGLIFCGMVGAITWNVATWWFGIPSSSSHALVGGLTGAVVVAVGPDYVVWGFGEIAQGHLTGVTKILLALVLSPVIGFWVGFVIHRTARRMLQRAHPRINTYLRRAQWVSAAGLAFGHGANDAQKSMGIVTLVLFMGGYIPAFEVPSWVIWLCAAAITLGILSGGWRIVRTVGFSIYKVRPLHALDAQLTSAAVIFSASMTGAPVSTTHVVSSSIMGIGSSERPRSVRWAKAIDILSTWIITIPGSATVAILTYYLVHITGIV